MAERGCGRTGTAGHPDAVTILGQLFGEIGEVAGAVGEFVQAVEDERCGFAVVEVGYAFPQRLPGVLRADRDAARLLSVGSGGIADYVGEGCLAGVALAKDEPAVEVKRRSDGKSVFAECQ